MNTKTNCIIIHGCPSSAEKEMDSDTRTYDKHWIPWLKEQLSALDIKTEAPLMPNPWRPVYRDFKAEFEKYPVNEDSVLIGHSCGTTFLTRWLADTKQKVAKLILVAPWCIADKDDDARREFYGQPVDASIKERVGEVIIFTSDDEREDGKKSAKMFHDSLGGELIELSGYGHYTMRDMGKTELPELLEQIVSFDNRKALLVPINQNKEILIQDRRGHKKPDWGYFGGEIEENETSLAAVIRESKEELDIDIKQNELKYIGASSKVWEGMKIIRYMYLYPTDQKEFNILEGNGGHWLTFDEARKRLEKTDSWNEIISKINSKP